MSKRRIIIVSVGLIVLLGFSFVLMQVLVGMKPEPPRKAEEVVKRFVKLNLSPTIRLLLR